MQIHKGCEEGNCNDDKCTKCFKYFENSDGSCDENKKVDSPKFTLLGFGNFKRKGKRVIFVLYLRIRTGMMYNAKITFNLIIETSSGRRFLSSEKTGTCLQNNIAQGTYFQNSQMSDFFIKI